MQPTTFRRVKLPPVATSYVCMHLCRCSCGDAVCTIAVSTTFSEPFVTQIGHRRLEWVHKKLAGPHCSDHVALLHAFQLWEDARLAYAALSHRPLPLY